MHGRFFQIYELLEVVLLLSSFAAKFHRVQAWPEGLDLEAIR
jgi:hypothetical protein